MRSMSLYKEVTVGYSTNALFQKDSSTGERSVSKKTIAEVDIWVREETLNAVL